VQPLSFVATSYTKGGVMWCHIIQHN